MTTKDALEHLAGRIAAIEAIACALIATQDQALCDAFFNRCAEIRGSADNAGSLSLYARGFLSVGEKVREMQQDAERHDSTPEESGALPH